MKVSGGAKRGAVIGSVGFIVYCGEIINGCRKLHRHYLLAARRVSPNLRNRGQANFWCRVRWYDLLFADLIYFTSCAFPCASSGCLHELAFDLNAIGGKVRLTMAN